MSQRDLLEKQEEWADTIEIKPKIKTNIKMRVTPEQRKEIEKICPFVRHFSEKTKYIFIYDNFLTWSEDDKHFGRSILEEIDADLFIKTNGTCIEEPKEIEHQPNLIDEFSKLTGLSKEEIRLFDKLIKEKNKKEDYKNSHYKSQKIDTVARCKANMTLEQQKTICIFNCDKYLHRSKGQDLEDIQKVRYYLDWLEEIENKLKDKE